MQTIMQPRSQGSLLPALQRRREPWELYSIYEWNSCLLHAFGSFATRKKISQINLYHTISSWQLKFAREGKTTFVQFTKSLSQIQDYFAVYDKDCRNFELHASMRSPENQMTVLRKFLLMIHNHVNVWTIQIVTSLDGISGSWIQTREPLLIQNGLARAFVTRGDGWNSGKSKNYYGTTVSSCSWALWK